MLNVRTTDAQAYRHIHKWVYHNNTRHSRDNGDIRVLSAYQTLSLGLQTWGVAPER